MRLLFVGDVVGKPGRRALLRLLPGLVADHRVEYVIVNIENAAGGFGITPQIIGELAQLPIDCFSSGNHIWDRKEGLGLLDRGDILRPENYPEGNPGTGLHLGETKRGGVKVATISLEGRVFMKDLDSPFTVADRCLAELPPDVHVILVDFHAEATSEKQAMAYYLDGRVSAVVGTHTHVPTADERILAGGTALQTDVGMTGPYDGIIGFNATKVLRRFALQRNIPFEVAKGDIRLAGVIIDVDAGTGKATTIERLLVPLV